MPSEEDRARLYATIPEDVDVLVTHGPPWGVLDRAPGSNSHVGCRQLLAAVRRVKPVAHVFGHVHGCYGTYDTPKTLFVNSALLGIDGELDRAPVIIKIPRKR